MEKELLAKEQPVKLLGIAGIVNKTLEDYEYDKSMLIQILLRLQNRFRLASDGNAIRSKQTAGDIY